MLERRLNKTKESCGRPKTPPEHSQWAVTQDKSVNPSGDSISARSTCSTGSSPAGDKDVVSVLSRRFRNALVENQVSESRHKDTDEAALTCAQLRGMATCTKHPWLFAESDRIPV